MAELEEYADTLHLLSKNEVIKIITTHLLEQGIRSQTPNEEKCLYKGPDSLGCAAAPFVKYEDWMDEEGGSSWDEVMHTPKHKEIIISLQNIHDNWQPINWLSQIKKAFPNADYSFLKKVKIHDNCRSNADGRFRLSPIRGKTNYKTLRARGLLYYLRD